MDYQPTTNNEDEFAKALNNLGGSAGSPSNDFFADSNNTSYLNQTSDEVVTSTEPAAMPEPAQEIAPSPDFKANPAPAPRMGGDLSSLKTSVLTDLRPVIDNVNIEAGEKYHLLSTLFKANKDSTIIEPAYTAARQIADDTKRAEALLEIVHDIDSVN